MYEWVKCVRHFHPSCTNLPGPAWQNEACSQLHHSNHLAKWKELDQYSWVRNQKCFYCQYLKIHFRITIPIMGCSSFIHCKAWRHERESVKTMYLDAAEFFFLGFNVCPDFSSNYECWIRQSRGNYGVWWKKCNTSHIIPCLVFPWKATDK